MGWTSSEFLVQLFRNDRLQVSFLILWIWIYFRQKYGSFWRYISNDGNTNEETSKNVKNSIRCRRALLKRYNPLVTLFFFFILFCLLQPNVLGGNEHESASTKESPLWMKHLENIKQMRSNKDAPVDSMGCHMLADALAEPKVW